MPTLAPGTYPAFIEGYLSFVKADSVGEALEKYPAYIRDFFAGIPAEKANYSYSKGKWTLKEVLQHVIDSERVFAYRALCIARHDTTPLPGFDQDPYAEYSEANSRSWQDLLEEFYAVRQSSDLLIKSFSENMLLQRGTTNSEPNNTAALSYLIFGHILYHINIIKERYL